MLRAVVARAERAGVREEKGDRRGGEAPAEEVVDRLGDAAEKEGDAADRRRAQVRVRHRPAPRRQHGKPVARRLHEAPPVAPGLAAPLVDGRAGKGHGTDHGHLAEQIRHREEEYQPQRRVPPRLEREEEAEHDADIAKDAERRAEGEERASRDGDGVWQPTARVRRRRRKAWVAARDPEGERVGAAVDPLHTK